MAITKVTEGVRTLGTGEVATANMATDPTNASNLSSGSVPLAQLGNAPATDVTGINDDIALLGFKVAANGSLARYNLVDQSIDDFQDGSGVDASTSTAEQRSSNNYYSGLTGNYFGTGSLGNCQFGASAITQTGDTVAIDTVLTTGSEAGGPGTSSYPVDPPSNQTEPLNKTACYETTILNTVGDYDGDMWVGNFGDLTIDASVTLTTDRPCRGMLIYCTGDAVINGSLSMSVRGGLADPTSAGGSDSAAVDSSGIQLGLFTAGGSQTLAAHTFAGCGDAAIAAVANQSAIDGDGDIFTIGRQGAAGGSGDGAAGAAGTTGGTTLTTGGGGAGNRTGSGDTGTGGTGYCFSGGSGSGGAGGSATSGNPAAYGGVGGLGETSSADSGAGGIGNPGGEGSTTGNFSPSGNGGLIFLIVNGDITIGSGAFVSARGQDGSTYTEPGSYPFGGGASGGGAIFVLHGGTLTNNGTITAAGYIGTVGWSASSHGGDGGTGGKHNLAITPQTPVDMSLVSNTLTSVDAVTKGDMVMTYTNGVGTATLNTDLKGFVSRDNGANYTELTLASQGTTGGHTVVTAHDVTLGGTDTSQMRWKVTTHNQSVSKETRIQAVSLGWS